MAERKFDYENIKSIYEKMNNTIGDSSDTDDNTICGLLNKINNTYNDYVNVKDKAIYGELGSQLWLDWDNTSAGFSDFMSNFSNWSALVSQAAGNYSEFESAYNTIKSEYAYGLNAVDSNGNPLKSSIVNSGIYSNFDDKTFNELREALAIPIQQMTNETYIDTGAVAAEKSREFWSWVSVIGTTFSLVADGATIAKSVSQMTKIFKETKSIKACYDITNMARLSKSTKNVLTASKDVRAAQTALKNAKLLDNADDIAKFTSKLDDAIAYSNDAKTVLKGTLKGYNLNVDDIATGAKQMNLISDQAKVTKDAFKNMLKTDIGDGVMDAAKSWRSEAKTLSNLKSGNFGNLLENADELSNVNKLVNADDLIESANDYRRAESELSSAFKSGKYSEEQLGALEQARDLAKAKYVENGGNANELIAAGKKLDDAEDALNSALKSGKYSEEQLGALEEARDLARADYGKLFNSGSDTDSVKAISNISTDVSSAGNSSLSEIAKRDLSTIESPKSSGNGPLANKASVDVSDEGIAARNATKINSIDKRVNTDDLISSANDYRKAESELNSAFKSGKYTEEQLNALEGARDLAKAKYVENDGNANELIAAGKKLDDAEDALNSALKSGKYSEEQLGALEEARDLAKADYEKNIKSISGIENGISQDDLARDVQKIINEDPSVNTISKISTDNMSDIANRDLSTIESPKSSGNGPLANKARMDVSDEGIAARNASTTSNVSTGKSMSNIVNRDLSTIESPKNSGNGPLANKASVDVSDEGIAARNATKINSIDKSVNTDDLISSANDYRNAESELNSAFKSGRYTEEQLNALEGARDLAKAKYVENDGNANELIAAGKKLDDAEDALNSALKSGKYSEEQLGALEEARDLARADYGKIFSSGEDTSSVKNVSNISADSSSTGKVVKSDTSSVVVPDQGTQSYVNSFKQRLNDIKNYAPENLRNITNNVKTKTGELKNNVVNKTHDIIENIKPTAEKIGNNLVDFSISNAGRTSSALSRDIVYEARKNLSENIGTNSIVNYNGISYIYNQPFDSNNETSYTDLVNDSVNNANNY